MKFLLSFCGAVLVAGKFFLIFEKIVSIYISRKYLNKFILGSCPTSCPLGSGYTDASHDNTVKCKDTIYSSSTDRNLLDLMSPQRIVEKTQMSLCSEWEFSVDLVLTGLIYGTNTEILRLWDDERNKYLFGLFGPGSNGVFMLPDENELQIKAPYSNSLVPIQKPNQSFGISNFSPDPFTLVAKQYYVGSDLVFEVLIDGESKHTEILPADVDHSINDVDLYLEEYRCSSTGSSCYNWEKFIAYDRYIKTTCIQRCDEKRMQRSLTDMIFWAQFKTF